MYFLALNGKKTKLMISVTLFDFYITLLPKEPLFRKGGGNPM